MKKIKVVVTGGPSGGKTTLIEALQKDIGNGLSVVPEAASLLYRGGFPRRPTFIGRRHAQMAICHVQRELEDMISSESPNQVIVCDRGSVDSVAYWPGDPQDLFASLRTTREQELARYDWVLHLDTADGEHFGNNNPVRTETWKEALELNEMIKVAWQGHPKRIVIPHSADFLEKIAKARKAILMVVAGKSHDEIQRELFQS
jgi:predicted ATPase